MKYIRSILVVLVVTVLFTVPVFSQCAVCTKTALQMGEKPAQGLNSAIIYLMAMPFVIVGFIGYRWWKGNKKFEDEELQN